VYKHSAVFSFGFLYKSKHGVDDILIDNILNIILCPVECQKTHSFDSGIILAVSSCAIDHMSNLIEHQPFHILNTKLNT
jgi:hypothetical protein